MAEWATFAGLAAGGYGALTAVLYAVQRRLLYVPDREPPSRGESGVPDMAEVTLRTEDGLLLGAWHAPAAPGRPTMVYYHGNGGHIGYRGRRVRPYLEAGLGVLLVGYRGYGANPGRPTEAGLYHDARAGLAFAKESGIAAPRLVLYGESLGTTVAVRMAAEMARDGRPPAAVILEAPLSSVTDVAAHQYPYLPVRWLLKDRFEAIAHVGAIGAPILIVHGDADDVVPIRCARALFAAASEPKSALWIAGGGHEDLDRFGLHAAVLDFIAHHARGERRGSAGGAPEPLLSPSFPS